MIKGWFSYGVIVEDLDKVLGNPDMLGIWSWQCHDRLEGSYTDPCLPCEDWTRFTCCVQFNQVKSC